MNTTTQRVQSFQPSRVVGTGQRRSDQCNQRNNLESVEEGNSRSTDHITQTKRREGVLGELTKRKNALKKRRQRLQKQQKSGFWRGLRECFKACRVESEGRRSPGQQQCLGKVTARRQRKRKHSETRRGTLALAHEGLNQEYLAFKYEDLWSSSK